MDIAHFNNYLSVRTIVYTVGQVHSRVKVGVDNFHIDTSCVHTSIIVIHSLGLGHENLIINSNNTHSLARVEPLGEVTVKHRFSPLCGQGKLC